MSSTDMATMAHLLRRAGFGATRGELEEYSAKGYAATVEELLHPDDPNRIPDDLIWRYHPDQSEARVPDCASPFWLYRMATTSAPLEEKIALFWHSLFATGEKKVNQVKVMLDQIEMFRRFGLGSFRTLLVELARDPAMLFWLDNNDNHNGAINENFGRELLELFAMGIGNYTEEDIKECSRAFTGWTIENAEYMLIRANKASIWPYSKVAWQFEYRADDHDDGEKTFLGETGRFNGEDVIDIIARHPATARFVSKRLYQFFVSFEVDDEGEAFIDTLAQAYLDSDYKIRSVLRTLFHSDHFKSDRVRFAQVKSPVELVVGALRTAEAVQWPSLEVRQASLAASYMGQFLLDPPTVEGWHEGYEWISSGALIDRINFAASYLGDTSQPGIHSIVERLASMDGGSLSPEEAVDGCLDLLGPISVSDITRETLIRHVARDGDLKLRDDATKEHEESRVGDLISLIASSREFQMA